jgi:hypothetical protein
MGFGVEQSLLTAVFQHHFPERSQKQPVNR